MGVALAVALSRVGFTVDSTPGLNATLVGQSDRIEPFGVRERLASDPEAVAAWQELCTRVGIAEVDLGPSRAHEPAEGALVADLRAAAQRGGLKALGRGAFRLSRRSPSCAPTRSRL